jgi:hypothetical protein
MQNKKEKKATKKKSQRTYKKNHIENVQTQCDLACSWTVLKMQTTVLTL